MKFSTYLKKKETEKQVGLFRNKKVAKVNENVYGLYALLSVMRHDIYMKSSSVFLFIWYGFSFALLIDCNKLWMILYKDKRIFYDYDIIVV